MAIKINAGVIYPTSMEYSNSPQIDNIKITQLSNDRIRIIFNQGQKKRAWIIMPNDTAVLLTKVVPIIADGKLPSIDVNLP